MQNWELRASVEIGRLYPRYITLVDGNRPTELSRLFAEDGVLISQVMGRECRGRRAIEAFIGQLRSSWTDIRIHITPPDITFGNEDRAEGTCYFTVLDPTGLDHWGTYSDAFERHNDEWLFSRRMITLNGRSSASPVSHAAP
jgi:hypothetical protein